MEPGHLISEKSPGGRAAIEGLLMQMYRIFSQLYGNGDRRLRSAQVIVIEACCGPTDRSREHASETDALSSSAIHTEPGMVSLRPNHRRDRTAPRGRVEKA